MTKKDVISRIIKLVEKESGETEVCKNDVISLWTVNEYNNNYSLLSSLGIVSVLVSIEREFDIEIDDEEMMQFSTIIELAEIVYKKLES